MTCLINPCKFTVCFTTSIFEGSLRFMDNSHWFVALSTYAWEAIFLIGMKSTLRRLLVR